MKLEFRVAAWLAGFQKPDPMDFVRTATATQALPLSLRRDNRETARKVI